MISQRKFCPCSSGQEYCACCQQLHRGAAPEHALALMRSRYSAYALHLASYIVDTTHAENSYFRTDRQAWLNEIDQFCRHTKFIKLEIVEFTDGDVEAYVTFRAHLEQNKVKSVMVEKSIFRKELGRWLYYGHVDLETLPS